MSTPVAQTQPAHERPRSLWRTRDYMLLWSGQTISSVGTQVSGIAFPLLILLITRSPAQAGIAGALRSVPYLVFSLPVGALIDRWNRKRVMIYCDAGRALALASIPLALAFNHLTILQIYLVALIEGTLFVFFNIAEVACLPRVVRKDQLPAATAQNQATEATASLIGPSLSGVLYTIAHSLPFLTDAISYTASVFSLFLIRTPFQGERASTPLRLRHEIAKGLAWLWRQPLIRYIAFLTGGLNFVTAGSPLLIIVIAQSMGASPALIGLIFAIEGAGAILGSVLAVPLQQRIRFGPAIILTVWLWALLWPLYAIAPNPILLGLIGFASATIGPLYNVVQFSYRLSLIPDELQGRVNSVFRLVAFGFQPLGFAITGVLLQTIHPVPTVLLLFGVMLALALLTTLNPHVRTARVQASA
ncbi:MAG: MFS-type drug/proton antiporter [Ktedonobacterales bacterium]|jgi:MFS family permease|nr:MAG: MFS-type drug/proton antiporter [Ktedonobacterales bacterium]